MAHCHQPVIIHQSAGAAPPNRIGVAEAAALALGYLGAPQIKRRLEGILAAANAAAIADFQWTNGQASDMIPFRYVRYGLGNHDKHGFGVRF